jgi:hypothetical protein
VAAPSADNYRYWARFKINVNSGSEQLIREGINTSRNEFPYQCRHRVDHARSCGRCADEGRVASCQQQEVCIPEQGRD